MKRTYSITSDGGMINIDFKTPYFCKLPKVALIAMNKINGVSSAFGHDEYSGEVFVGRLYEHEPIIQELNNIMHRTIHPPFFKEIAEDVPIPETLNGFLLWMGSICAIGYVLSKIFAGG